MIQSLFFELIRVSIGQATCLSKLLSAEEWDELFAMAKRQSLLGVCFAGVQQLKKCNQCPPVILYRKWMMVAAKTLQRNERLNDQCVALQKQFKEAGIRSSILKGQATATLYKNGIDNNLSLLRQCGDIDIFVDCGRKKAIEYAKQFQNIVEWDYKHLHLNVFKDAGIEVHYRPQVLQNVRKNSKLQRWFKLNEHLFFEGNTTLHNGEVIVIPIGAMNVLYQVIHLYHHLFTEGIRLRQIMDLYYTLLSYDVDDDVLSVITELDLTHFANGLMWILQSFFLLPLDKMPWQPEENEGRFLLKEIMNTGNFSMLNSDNKCIYFFYLIKNNIHLYSHYKGDAFAAPFYFIWHKWWKVFAACNN